MGIEYGTDFARLNIVLVARANGRSGNIPVACKKCHLTDFLIHGHAREDAVDLGFKPHCLILSSTTKIE